VENSYQLAMSNQQSRIANEQSGIASNQSGKEAVFSLMIAY
jgi:hypothetical protein